MSELTDDRLDTKALAERALSNAAVASQHHIIDQGHEQADEVLCEALILNIEQAINLALRAAAGTEAVLREALELISRYLQTAHSDSERNPDKIDYINSLAVRDIAEIARSALTPPTPKVTTDEAEERK